MNNYEIAEKEFQVHGDFSYNRHSWCKGFVNRQDIIDKAIEILEDNNNGGFEQEVINILKGVE